jgi:ATP-dependent RNA helicase DeaD
MPRTSDTPPTGFASLGLSPEIVASVTTLGYEEPTPVQRETIPVMLSGRDLLAQAATGTGKTAAFALPMLQGIAGKDPGKRTAGLVLVPTRELAMQVAEAIHKYARGGRLSVVPLFGGASMQQQIRSLERGASIVVATPGRALDHIRRKTLALDKLQVLILDEADEMLDMGFAEDLDAILEATPKERQTALFSATMPARIMSIAQRHLKNAARITVASEKLTAGKLPRVRQVAYIVARAHKAVATDVAARGLDIQRISHVINYDVPADSESYVHRIGRTGRAGREGTAITLVEPREHRLLRSMESVTKQKVEVATLPTVADLRARRLDLTRASLRERLLAGGLDQARVVVETLAEEFDIVDVAAAAVQMAHTALGGDGDDKEIPVVAAQAPRDRDGSGPRGAGARGAGPRSVAAGGDGSRLLKPARGRLPRDTRDGGEDMTRLFVGAGRRAGIRPGDLVGAITGEAGIDSREIGAIEISDGFSLVEVPESRAQDIIAALKATKLRGAKVTVRRERDR